MEPDAQPAEMFVVDWTTTWTSLDEVSAAQRAFMEASSRMTARGTAVRCLNSLFLEGESRWICLFAAADRTVAAMTADMAQIPQRFVRVGIDLMAPPGNRSETL